MITKSISPMIELTKLQTIFTNASPDQIPIHFHVVEIYAEIGMVVNKLPLAKIKPLAEVRKC